MVLYQLSVTWKVLAAIYKKDAEKHFAKQCRHLLGVFPAKSKQNINIKKPKPN